MRPLFGVVTSADRTSVRIRLESGLVVHTPNDLGLARFDTVAVRYDYTENRVAGIERHDPDANAKEAGADESDPAVLEDAEENDDALEVLVETDSGALFPDDDWGWDSEEGVLLVEGESSTRHV